MLTAVTVGMGPREVSQVSYYPYNCHSARGFCITVLVSSQPDFLCCVQAKTTNGSATSYWEQALGRLNGKSALSKFVFRTNMLT